MNGYVGPEGAETTASGHILLYIYLSEALHESQNKPTQGKAMCLEVKEKCSEK